MFWKNRWNVHTLYVDDRIAKMSVARAVGPSVNLLTQWFTPFKISFCNLVECSPTKMIQNSISPTH
jgi:hypothetical protein